MPDGNSHLSAAIAEQEILVKRLQDQMRDSRPWSTRVQSAVDRVQGRTKEAEAAAAKVKQLVADLEAARVAATDADTKLAEAQADLEKVRAEGVTLPPQEETVTPPVTWDQWRQQHATALQHLAVGLQGVPPELLEFMQALVTAVPPTPMETESKEQTEEGTKTAKSQSSTQIDSTGNSQTQEVLSPMDAEETAKRARLAKEEEDAKRARLAKA